MQEKTNQPAPGQTGKDWPGEGDKGKEGGMGDIGKKGGTGDVGKPGGLPPEKK
jgi:hypothetical protein